MNPHHTQQHKARELPTGLYPVTDTALLKNRLLERVRATLEGGARIVQYRDKTNDHWRRLSEALQLKQLCTDHNALLIINDDVQLALEANADGVHIGAHDVDLLQARSRLGNAKIVGVSCYNQLSLALEAQAAGANYVAFGSFFSSSVKPQAVTASLDLLVKARQQLTIPVVAIGGITLENANKLVIAGADMLAVINGVFAQKAIQSTAQAFTDLYETRKYQP